MRNDFFVVLLWADSDMGSKRGVSVDPARQRERKNKNIIRTTRTKASTIVLLTSLIELRINTVSS